LRQPLQLMRAKVVPGNQELVELLKDELNIKEVEADSSLEEEAWLEVELTVSLKEEGSVREWVRMIQALRKEKGLAMQDRPTLVVHAPTADMLLLLKYKDQLQSQTGLSDLDVRESVDEAGTLQMSFAE
jgi:isoleucyl-tRNA synthetase